MMRTAGFFATLNYSSCNEDWRTERRALQIGPSDRVLCVTGSGDRPLHLLLDDPERLVAIDANPCQNHLLRLKMAAMRAFPHEEYVAFLGLTPARQRSRLLFQLADHMPEDTYSYWLHNNAAVERGILYQGRWERYYRAVSLLARMLRAPAIGHLFSLESLEEQRSFVREGWDKGWWRLVFDVLCSRRVSRLAFGDPGFYAHVDPQLQIGRYVYQGMLEILQRYLARENFMLSLLFLGRLSAYDLPPYLAADSFACIRGRLVRMEIRTARLTDYLKHSVPGSFTRFSFSDVPSYLDQAGFAELARAMVHAAVPGARFCIRQFLTNHRLPEQLSGMLRRESDIEDELRQADRSFAYRFMVGTIAEEEGR